MLVEAVFANGASQGLVDLAGRWFNRVRIGVFNTDFNNALWIWWFAVLRQQEINGGAVCVDVNLQQNDEVE